MRGDGRPGGCAHLLGKVDGPATGALDSVLTAWSALETDRGSGSKLYAPGSRHKDVGHLNRAFDPIQGDCQPLLLKS